MQFRHLRYKILILLALTLSLGFVGTAIFYMQVAERAVSEENNRSLHKLTESVISIIQTVMLDNHAEIMPDYIRRLRSVSGIVDFRILRPDGRDSFVDNETIDDVNARLKEEAFPRRRAVNNLPVLAPDSPSFMKALEGEEGVMEVETGTDGERFLHFFDPIDQTPKCARCHGRSTVPRGVIKVTTSLAATERNIYEVRFQAFLLLAVSLVATMLLTGFMLGRTVVIPLERVTKAMRKISAGNFSHRVEVGANDEIGHLADGFNAMTSELQLSYADMLRERDKLQTVVQGLQNAVIATDGKGTIVIVNKAAEEYLGKTAEQIRSGGILGIFDAPAIMQRLLAQEEGVDDLADRTVAYNNRIFVVSAASIFDEDGALMGSAALLQDITEEKRLLDELRRLSTTDALTGLYNRRHLDESLRNEIERSQQANSPLSLVLFDVDHFKRFNDTYGHDQGDRVLQSVALWMHQVTRQYDIACRYGGEEFVLILPATDLQAGLCVAERLRELVAMSSVDGLGVTISLGVACTQTEGLATPEKLIEAADSALYESKRGGRNRSTLFEK